MQCAGMAYGHGRADGQRNTQRVACGQGRAGGHTGGAQRGVGGWPSLLELPDPGGAGPANKDGSELRGF